MPRIPQVTAGPAQLGRRATPADVGGGAGLEAIGSALKETSDIASRLLIVQQTGRANLAISEANVEIRNAELEESQNSDHMGREGRLQQKIQDIHKRFSKEYSLLPKFASDFDNSFRDSSSQASLRIRSGVWKDTIDEAKATLDILGRSNATVAAATDIGPQRDTVIATHLKHIYDLNEQKLLSNQEAVAREISFRESIMTADFLKMVADDPDKAILQLGLGEESPYFGNAAPETRARWFLTAVRAGERKINKELAGGVAAERAESKARTRARNAARKTAVSLAEKGDWEAFNTHLLDAHEWFSADDWLVYKQMGRDRSLGAVTSSQFTVRKINKWLTKSRKQLVEEGVLKERLDTNGNQITISTLEELITAEYSELKLSQDDYRRFIELDKDKRLNAPRTTLVNALRVNDFLTTPGANMARVKAFNAIEAFDEWAFENPKASRAEARAKVSELIEAGSLVNLTDMEFTQLTPRYAVYGEQVMTTAGTARKEIDIRATREGTDKAFSSGKITKSEYEDQIELMKRLTELQQNRKGNQ